MPCPRSMRRLDEARSIVDESWTDGAFESPDGEGGSQNSRRHGASLNRARIVVTCIDSDESMHERHHFGPTERQGALFLTFPDMCELAQSPSSPLVRLNKNVKHHGRIFLFKRKTQG